MYKLSDHLNSSIVTVFNSTPKYIRSSNTASTFKKAPYHVFGLVKFSFLKSVCDANESTKTDKLGIKIF